MIKLTPAENKIKADGPITKVTEEDVTRGLKRYNQIRKALGAKSNVSQPHLFGSYSDGNSKLGKMSNKIFIGGVTYAPALTMKQWYDDLTHQERDSFQQEALDVHPDCSTSVLNKLTRHTICGKSTAGCRKACNLRTSGRMGMEAVAMANQGKAWFEGHIARAQLARTILLMFDPVGAVALMTKCIEHTAAEAKKLGVQSRWRLAVADDIRWEIVAPVILKTCKKNKVKMYGYTKWSPVDRPTPKGVKLVRSASERTTTSYIKDLVEAKENVAVVFDTKRKEELPPTWLGLKVVDGDVHDDRTADGTAVVIGLRAKGAAVGSNSRFIFPSDEKKALERV